MRGAQGIICSADEPQRVVLRSLQARSRGQLQHPYTEEIKRPSLASYPRQIRRENSRPPRTRVLRSVVAIASYAVALQDVLAKVPVGYDVGELVLHHVLVDDHMVRFDRVGDVEEDVLQ